MIEELSHGRIPGAWVEVQPLPTATDTGPNVASLDPISQEIQLPQEFGTLQETGASKPQAKSVREVRIAIKRNVEKPLETIHRERQVYDLAQLVSMAIAVADVSDASIQLGGFVAGCSTAEDSLRRLLVESKLALTGCGNRIHEDVGSNWTTEHGAGAVHTDGPTTYESLARDLSDQFDVVWEINPFVYAFRFVTGTHQLITPDQVIVSAASLDPTRVAQLEAPDQLELLAETLHNATYENQVSLVVEGENSIDSDISTVTREDVIRTHRSRLLSEVHKTNAFSFLPVVATTYPGAGGECSLSTLFRSLYVLHTGDRILYLDTNSADWAQNTLLLKLGRRLWQYRDDRVLKPLYERFDHQLTAESAGHVKRCIRQGSTLDEYYLRSAVDAMDSPESQTQRDRSADTTYSHLSNRLERLGQAIAGQRESDVKEFL